MDGLRHRSSLERSSSIVRSGWNNALAQIRNPDNDPRIDDLMIMVGEIYNASSTFRRRMDALAREGGVTIKIVPDDEIGHSFGHAVTIPRDRMVALTETTASNIPGSHYQSLNILLVELSNLTRASEIAQVSSDFREGRIGQRRAAHNAEKVEYGTIEDMTKYFLEARPVIESLGYGTPSLWYSGHDYSGRTVPVYQSFDDYYGNAVSSGHTNVYLDHYSRPE